MWFFRNEHGPDDPPLFSVGYFSPQGGWCIGLLYTTAIDAAKAVHFLNGAGGLALPPPYDNKPTRPR